MPQYRRWGLPMVLLMYNARTFCQFFLSSDTRKLTAKWMLYTSSSSVIFTWPTATARHSTCGERTVTGWRLEEENTGRLETHTRQTAHALAPGQDDGAHLKHQSNANPGSYVEEEGKLQDPPPVTMAEPFASSQTASPSSSGT